MILHLSLCVDFYFKKNAAASWKSWWWIYFFVFVYFWSWSLQNTHAKHKCLSLYRPVPRVTRCRLCCTFCHQVYLPGQRTDQFGPDWNGLTDIRFKWTLLFTFMLTEEVPWAGCTVVCLFPRFTQTRHFLCVSSSQTLIESISLKGTFLISYKRFCKVVKLMFACVWCRALFVSSWCKTEVLSRLLFQECSVFICSLCVRLYFLMWKIKKDIYTCVCLSFVMFLWLLSVHCRDTWWRFELLHWHHLHKIPSPPQWRSFGCTMFS